MKVLLFCNTREASQTIFDLIRKRIFAGVVIPQKNTKLIQLVRESGYLESSQIFTPNHKNLNAISKVLTQTKPSHCFVIGFPTIFPSEILSIPSHGFFNFHFSPLPTYKGPNPIFWQIKNEENSCGVTVHEMTTEIDSGKIYFQETTPINPSDTFGILQQNMSVFTSANMDTIIENIRTNKVTPLPEQADSSYFSQPTASDIEIDWQNMNCSAILAIINAGNPWNKGAICQLEGQEIRIIQATAANYNNTIPDRPGLIFHADQNDGVFVVTKDNQLLRIDAIYGSQGYAASNMLLAHGIAKGKIFT